MPPRLIWIFYHFLFACFCEKRPLNIKVWRKLSNFEVWIWMWRLIFLIYHEMWYDNNQNLFVRPCAFDVLSKVFHPAQLHIRPFLCTYLEDHSRVTIIIFRRPYVFDQFLSNLLLHCAYASLMKTAHRLCKCQGLPKSWQVKRSYARKCTRSS